MVPMGTYNVALLKVFKLKVLKYSDDLPYILNGFFFLEITSGKSQPSKAFDPILVTGKIITL